MSLDISSSYQQQGSLDAQLPSQTYWQTHFQHKIISSVEESFRELKNGQVKSNIFLTPFQQRILYVELKAGK